MKVKNTARDSEVFEIEEFDGVNGFYFPLASETGLKSAVTPELAGDAKLDQNHFLLEPASIEDLNNRRSSRNFWVRADGQKAWSLTGASAWQRALLFENKREQVSFRAGFMWQEVTRANKELEIEACITSFVPSNENEEIHIVRLKNNSGESKNFDFFTAVPIYGRSADNLRDHRHVTSLLHRIEVRNDGIYVTPTLSFDERGHKKNEDTYFVRGCDMDGKLPVGFYPILDDFYGEDGNLETPKVIYDKGYEAKVEQKSGFTVAGVEAMGGMKFSKFTLASGEEKSFVICIGINNCSKPQNLKDALRLLEETKDYWRKKINVDVKTGNEDFDLFMKWVAFQPELRRLFGCSFLPHHDYGRGGRGWRDLWQDCLALLLMNPENVRSLLVSNFKGLREDGTNATIIGNEPGEFKADRNGISRVWMDHGFWPLMTVLLYINQTGDIGILQEKVGYFESDREGTILDHLLRQNLRATKNLGAHGHCRLEGADWNDALDMASEKGESVAFTCAYVMNLKQLADLMEKHKELPGDAIEELRFQAEKLTANIRAREWIEVDKKTGFFNGYYDNDGQPLEGIKDGRVNMMLTSQVFAIMSGIATDDQVEKIIRACDTYLYDEKCGGYRLNTDFNEVKLNMGRMFGFAYGEKENGAVFSHMAVMYAKALYSRGFAAAGYKALAALFNQSDNTKISRIFPGIPEYFGRNGRGLYHYLTGAASWYLMTVVQEMFGVKPIDGRLTFSPSLMASQFDENGQASLGMVFEGQQIEVTYENKKRLDYGSYQIHEVHEQEGKFYIILGEKDEL